MSKKNKKILSLLSFVSLGTIVTSIVTPIIINNNHNSNISIVNTNNEVTTSFNGITNIAATINASPELSSKYPIELFISAQNESFLKDLIISSVVDPASKLNHGDIVLDKNKSVVNNLEGTIDLVFDIVNFKVVINNGSQLVTTQSKTFNTKIQNLQRATPSNIPNNGSEVTIPTEFNNYTNVESIDLLSKKILPAVIGGSQVSSFSIDVREAEPIFPNKLLVSIIVGNYFDKKGEFINYSGLVKFTLSGFKPLVNSSYSQDVDASSLGIDSDSLTLQNSFELIKSNINNLSSELTINDIENFSIEHLYSENKAVLTFDIINKLWVEDGLVDSKTIQMNFINLNESTNTTINTIIKTSSISSYTSSEVKATSNGAWETNSTIKTIIASSINSPADGATVTAVDIEITKVKEVGSIGNNNYSQLDVNFNLINYSGMKNNEPVESMPLSTSIKGFKTLSATSINSKILAKTSNNSEIGIKVYDDIYATDLKQEQAKYILASNITNGNGLISPNDIEITSFTPNLNAATIDIQFNLKNNKYVDNQGNVISNHQFTTQLFGFKFFEGATRFVGLSDNMVLDNNGSFLTPIVLPSATLASNIEFIKAVVRSFVEGPIPNNFKIDINNINTSVPKVFSFDATITNYFSSTELVTTPKVFTGIKITNLPSNTPTGTYNLPIVPAKASNEQKVVTINDFRPEGSNYNNLKQLLIDKAIKNPFVSLKPNDIEIITTGNKAPNFSSSDNTITVTYKIVNNKFKDPNTQQGTNSEELKVKFVGFNSVSLIDTSKYTMSSINNPLIANEYATEFFKNKIQTISNNDRYNLSEKNILIQNILSDFVQVNLSNLNLNNTRFDFSPNDRVGSITISIYSWNFYTSNGTYMPTDTLITKFVLNGFAVSNVQSETSVTWKGVEPLNIFASDLSLLNISDILTLNNLPVGVQPTYIFEARDTIVEQGKLLDYGEVDVKVSLNSYFNNNGDLIFGKKEFKRTFKTIPFLNTSLDYIAPDVIFNSNDRGIVASQAKDGTIKNIIAKNLNQLPTDFNAIKDIEIIEGSKKADDEKGTLQVSFVLNKYYKDGRVVESKSRQYDITIDGFYKVDSLNKINLPFYKEQWFILLVSVTGASILLLIIILILSKIRLNKKRW